VGIDIGLQLSHTLKDSACSLRLIQGFMHCPSAYRHHIHRDTLNSITHTLKTRCKSGIRTYLGKIKAHNHSLGNLWITKLHPPDTTCTTGLIRVYMPMDLTTHTRTLNPRRTHAPHIH
jgi:hypothetical protein